MPPSASDYRSFLVPDFGAIEIFLLVLVLGHLFVVFLTVNIVPNIQVFVHSLNSLYTELIS